MFIPWQNINYFKVFYMGTDPNVPKPGDVYLQIQGDGLKVKRYLKTALFVSTKQMVRTKVDYSVGSAGLSASGALVGGMLAGEVGALAGAASGRGRKTVDSFVTLVYKDGSGKEQKLTFNSKMAEKIQKKLNKKYQLAV